MRDAKRQIAAVAFFLIGCGDSESDGQPTLPSAPGEPAVAMPVAPSIDRAYVRVELEQDPLGAITISEVSTLASAIPPSPLAVEGDALVLAYDGVDVVGVDVVRFPRAGIVDGPEGARVVRARTAQFTALLPVSRAPTRLEVRLQDGTIAVALNLTDPGTLTKGIARVDAALASLPRHPHVRILTPGDQRKVPAEYSATVGMLIEPTPTLIAELEAALDRASPSVRSAVRQVGFTAGIAGSHTHGVAFGPTALISAGAITRTEAGANPSFPIYVINHELAHCYGSFVDNVIDDPGWRFDLSSWDGPLKEVAAEQVRALGLSTALSLTWHELHQTGVNMRLAPDYAWNDASQRPVTSAAVEAGFATSYGATNAHEDIAEFAAQLQVPEHTKDSGQLCGKLQQDRADAFPVRHAIAYAKLEFSRALGLVTEDRFRACVGALDLKGPPGIHLRSADGSVRSLGGDLRANRGETMGVPVLNVLASDGSYRSLLQVEATHGGLGLHRLDDHTGLFDIALGANTFMAADNDDHAFISESGLVLVTAFDRERVEGIVFLMSLRNAWRTTDAFPIGTFRVDQPAL